MRLLIVSILTLVTGCATSTYPTRDVPGPCSAAAPDAQYEAHAAGTVQAGGVELVRAWCNAGDAVVTGGCVATDPAVQVLGSTPVVADAAQGEPASWACTVQNNSGTISGATANVVCQAAAK